MSDDEDVIPVKKSKQVHYGSLEEQEKARLAALAAAVREGVEDSGGKELGDIQISNGELEDVYVKYTGVNHGTRCGSVVMNTLL